MAIIGDALAYSGQERGCGKRVPGGIYAECGLSEEGEPVEHFLFCPPLPVDAEQAGVAPLGVKLIQAKDGVWHILDWVGTKHYRNVADFVEEVRRLGASRRLSPQLDYSLLTERSKLLLMHEKAIITNRKDLWGRLADTARECPKGRIEHSKPELDTRFSTAPLTPNDPDWFPMCAKLWYEVLEGGESVGEDGDGYRDVKREMPSFPYCGRRAPEGFQVEYQLGIFMRLPISRIAIVRDAAGGTHADAFEAVSATSLPVDLVIE